MKFGRIGWSHIESRPSQSTEISLPKLSTSTSTSKVPPFHSNNSNMEEFTRRRRGGFTLPPIGVSDAASVADDFELLSLPNIPSLPLNTPSTSRPRKPSLRQNIWENQTEPDQVQRYHTRRSSSARRVSQEDVTTEYGSGISGVALRRSRRRSSMDLGLPMQCLPLIETQPNIVSCLPKFGRARRRSRRRSIKNIATGLLSASDASLLLTVGIKALAKV